MEVNRRVNFSTLVDGGHLSDGGVFAYILIYTKIFDVKTELTDLWDIDSSSSAIIF